MTFVPLRNACGRARPLYWAHAQQSKAVAPRRREAQRSRYPGGPWHGWPGQHGHGRHQPGDEAARRRRRLPAPAGHPLLLNPVITAMAGNRQLFSGLERQGDQADPNAPLFVQGGCRGAG